MPPPSPASPYDHDFYGHQAPGSARSASVVLPVVHQLLRPGSVVDVGCGVGTWLRVALDLGATRVVGIDGDYARTSGLQISADSFVAADLFAAVPVLGERFDLAISLEVAEHLPAARSDTFVAELCALSDVVLFSAAIPGQLGTDHINLQPQRAWVDRFALRGYRAFDLVRPHVWDDERVEAFYRQNVLVFVNSERTDLVRAAGELSLAAPALIDVVHPELLAFWVRRATRPVSTRQGLALTWAAVRRAVARRLGR